MAATKFSKQREAIKEYLASTHEHPTADKVYSTIRETFPNISLGTVYRNLNFLAEQGEIIKLSCGDGCDHFDYDTSEHYHFICNKCNAVLDLKMEPINHIDTIAGAHFDGEIQGHQTYFYGTCPNCKLS